MFRKRKTGGGLHFHFFGTLLLFFFLFLLSGRLCLSLLEWFNTLEEGFEEIPEFGKRSRSIASPGGLCFKVNVY